jgi:predicted kinase
MMLLFGGAALADWLSMKNKGKLHLIVGPVGAGKTTFARQRVIREGGVFFDVDFWMMRLYSKDTRPSENAIAWYLERRERCRALIWESALSILTSGVHVFLELGLLSKAEREPYYERARDVETDLVVFVIEAPREIRRTRVAERNRLAGEFTQIVPMDFFELASDAWQSPLEAERRAVSIVDI